MCCSTAFNCLQIFSFFVATIDGCEGGTSGVECESTPVGEEGAAYSVESASFSISALGVAPSMSTTYADSSNGIPTGQ